MWRLLFKTEEAALAAGEKMSLPEREGLPDLAVSVTDDFGQTCAIRANRIIACMIEDLDLSKQAGAEMMLHNARTQAMAQTIARQEPALRSAGQGPSVFVPNGGGRMS